MSITNFKKPGSNCSDNHSKVGKHIHSHQDHAIAECIISDLARKSKYDINILRGISKNILRLTVTLLEYGRGYSNTIIGCVVLRPSTQRSKPLCKFTKCQLVRRIVQIFLDFDSQINTITARKKQEAERQEAERQEAERQQEQNVCPICLDPLENQAQCTAPCGHTFCSPCFMRNISTELSRGYTAKCPCCRRTTVEIDVRNAW